MSNLCKMSVWLTLPVPGVEASPCGGLLHVGMLHLSSLRKSKRVQGTKKRCQILHEVQQAARAVVGLRFLNRETSSIFWSVLKENTVQAVLCCQPLLELIDWSAGKAFPSSSNAIQLTHLAPFGSQCLAARNYL